MVLEDLADVSDGGSLLSNGDVNAIKLLVCISGIEVGLLVDNGINGNGSLSSLSVTNNELSLSSSDWYKTVDGLETGLHGLVD